MVKIDRYDEKENLLLPLHGILFPISTNQGSFHRHYPKDNIALTIAFAIRIVEHWLELRSSKLCLSVVKYKIIIIILYTVLIYSVHFTGLASRKNSEPKWTHSLQGLNLTVA